MEKIIEKLVKQQTEICELLGDEALPVKHPKISAANLTQLKDSWARMGGSIPADYEEFLKICDGIDNFSPSYHLFGSKIFASANYLDQSWELRKIGVGLQESPTDKVIFLGWHEETTTCIFYDFNSKIPVLYDGEPGFLSIYESFAQFLNLKITANEMTIKRILDMQKETPEDD